MDAKRASSEEGATHVEHIKEIFMTQYNLRIDESILGHTSISSLLKDPQLAELVCVEERNEIFVVVPRGSAAEPASEDHMAAQSTPEDAAAMSSPEGMEKAERSSPNIH